MNQSRSPNPYYESDRPRMPIVTDGLLKAERGVDRDEEDFECGGLKYVIVTLVDAGHVTSFVKGRSFGPSSLYDRRFDTVGEVKEHLLGLLEAYLLEDRERHIESMALHAKNFHKKKAVHRHQKMRLRRFTVCL